MLVLSRRLNEKILLPSIHTSVEVLDIKGDRVRLGIEAPASVTILREELAARQAAEGASVIADDSTGQAIGWAACRGGACANGTLSINDAARSSGGRKPGGRAGAGPSPPPSIS